MAITAYSGPVVSFGLTQSSTGGGITGSTADPNGQRGPSLFDLGVGMMDPRVAYQYKPGAGTTVQVLGFPNGEAVIDMLGLVVGATNAFATAGTSNLAGGTISLVAASSARGTYATTIVAPENGATVSVIAIDSTASALSFGSDTTVAYWNPAGGSGRCLTFFASAADGGFWTIIGRDMYGFKMTEQVTVGTSLVNSKRAYKYIQSIIASTTLTSTGVNIGLSQIFGMPLAVSYMGPHVKISLSSSPYSVPGAVVTTSAANPDAIAAGEVLLASTATPTSTTYDVRGLYRSSTALAVASSQRLMIRVTPTAAALASITSGDVSSLFGLTQFSSV